MSNDVRKLFLIGKDNLNKKKLNFKIITFILYYEGMTDQEIEEEKTRKFYTIALTNKYKDCQYVNLEELPDYLKEEGLNYC